MNLFLNNNDKWNNIHSLLEKELTNNMKKYHQKLNDTKIFNYSNKNQNSDINFIVLNYSNFISPNFMVQRYIKQKGRYTYHNDFSVNWIDKKYLAVTFIWYLNTISQKI